MCYVPPESSSRGNSAEETLQALAEGVEKYSSLGSLMICGDFDARLGDAGDEVDGIPRCKIIDMVKNSQGNGFVDFLRSTDMCVKNGRKGRDAFTCVSGRGGSVIDYCVVEMENLDMIKNFRLTTMCEEVQEMRIDGMARVCQTTHYCSGILHWRAWGAGGRRRKSSQKPHRRKLGGLSQRTTWKIV